MFYAPILTGGDKPAVGGVGVKNLSDSLKLKRVHYQQLGNDIMMRAEVA